MDERSEVNAKVSQPFLVEAATTLNERQHTDTQKPIKVRKPQLMTQRLDDVTTS